MSRFKVDAYTGGSKYLPVPLCREGAEGAAHFRITDTETHEDYIVELHWDGKGSLDLRYWTPLDSGYKEKISLSAIAVMEGLANIGNAK